MASTPWLDLARGEIGTHEVAGPSDNPRIMAYYRDAGHPEIDHEETPWCAAFVGAMLKRAGYPNTRSLAARSYCTYGVGLDTPVSGCIMVKKRGGNSWEGHVGFFVGEGSPGYIKVLGGNQRDAVNVAEFPKSEVIAYRMPVAATVPALREAGSTEIASADNIQKAAAATAATAATAAASQPAPSPPIIPAIPPEAQSITEYVSFAQQAQEGFRAIVELVHQYWWAGALLACVAAWLAARWWKRNRVERAAAGVPLSTQMEGQ